MIIKLSSINDNSLRSICLPVIDFQEGPFDSFLSHAENLARTLETMLKLHQDAAGIALPQIGFGRRGFIIRHQYDPYSTVYFNPVFIINSKTTKEIKEEGCLSIPNKMFAVERYVGVSKIVYQNVYGEWIVKENPSEYEEQIFQHEFDHLQGKTLYDTGREI